jgi:hypothetical protein
MRLASNTFGDGGVLPGRCGFAIKAPRGRITLGRNRNPELHWSDVPAGTRSLVLMVIDGDAPNPKPANVNTEGTTLNAKLPRGEFVHWLMVDIPPTVIQIAEGACSEGVVAKGKRHPHGPEGARQGLNDYTAWFGDDKDMGGPYLGYDGPCPPWNDSVSHHYRFELHATDLDRCPVDGQFRLAELRKALNGHVLASATLVGRYALNPAIRLR